MAEKIVLMFYITAHIIIGLIMIVTEVGVGEAVGIPIVISNFEVLGLLLITILSYILAYFLYRNTRYKKSRIKLIPKIKVNVRRFDVFFLILVLIQLAFSLTTGVGVVGRFASSKYSSLFAIFAIEQLFPFYYILCRQKKGRFILNVILFSIYQLVLGWTSFILMIAIFEMYYFFNRIRMDTLSRLSVLYFLPAVLILIGGKFYQYAFTFKNNIRYGFHLDIGYFEGLSYFVQRLSNFPMTVISYQNINLLAYYYKLEGIFMKEIQSVFRTLVPTFIMPVKDFRPLPNIVVQSMYSEVTKSTSTGFGMPMYIINLFNADFLSGLIYIILLPIMFSIVKQIFQSLESYKGQLNILYFLFIIALVRSGSLEIVFSYGYIKLAYLVPFLMLFKIIQFNSKESGKV